MPIDGFKEISEGEGGLLINIGRVYQHSRLL